MQYFASFEPFEIFDEFMRQNGLRKTRGTWNERWYLEPSG